MSSSIRIFQLVILLLPTQLTLHFWPSWTYIFGIKIDYLAPVIYLTDLLILLLAPQIKYTRKYLNLAAIALFFVALNIHFSNSPIATLFAWLKLAPDLLFGVYVYQNANKLVSHIYKPLLFSAITISTLAILQFIIRSSLGGPLYWIGERKLNVFTPGVAKQIVLGKQMLRPYATFPHPNALAGYLAAILIFLKLNKKVSKKSLIFIVLAISLTFSKNALSIFATILIISTIPKIKTLLTNSKQIIYLVLLISIATPLLSNEVLKKPISSKLPPSISRRLRLASWSGSVISQNTITGSGLGTLTLEVSKLNINSQIRKDTLSAVLQPVHNIYLLVLSEVGLLGLLLFAILILRISNNYALMFILLTGFLDHYWVTIKQTRLLFILFIALALREHSGRMRPNENRQ